MAKYRKKPALVEAMQFTDSDKDRVLIWMTGQVAPDFEDGRPVVKFRTVHGEVAVARLGDWIVQDGDLGTYYPVRPDIFAATYEPAD